MNDLQQAKRVINHFGSFSYFERATHEASKRRLSLTNSSDKYYAKFFPYRNLTNLETGSFEFLDNFGKPEMKEADAESLTESEELSIIGEDLVDYIIGTSVQGLYGYRKLKIEPSFD